MAAEPRSPKRGAISPVAGTVGLQIIVTLSRVCEAGVVFWSRHAFAVADELRLTLHEDGLPEPFKQRFAQKGPWVYVRGYVVECLPGRNMQGCMGYQVSLVFEPEPKVCSLRPTDKTASTSVWIKITGTDLEFCLN